VQLRVATINVQSDEGDPRRIALLNRELRELEPDIVALQEVLHEPGREQLEQLLDGTGLQGTHQANVMAYTPPFTDTYGGNAIATRWPHRIVEVLDLRLTDAPDVPWCTLAARIELPEEGELLAIATTTSWRLDAEAARERQVLAISDLDARHRTTLPTIIAGDLNAVPDASSIRFLTGRQSLAGRSVHYHDAWEVAGEGPGHTWTVDNPTARAEIEQIVRQPSIGAASTTCSPAPGTRTPRPTARSAPPGWRSTAPLTGCGPATTSASWSTLRSAPTTDRIV
jgi:endonuclease/exonuclease/phosphatase family metal-dependent hydrolase